jgi:hemin uptake protein HemP
MAQRKLLILGAMNIVLLVYRVVCMDATDLLVPVSIERQLGNDTVHFSSARGVISESCDTDDKDTYLVDDRRCVSNQELLNGNHSCIINYTLNIMCMHDCNNMTLQALIYIAIAVWIRFNDMYAWLPINTQVVSLPLDQ